MFEYRVNMDPTIKLKKRYNIIRHAGAIYAMSQYYELYPEDDEMRSAIERAGKYLRDEAIGPVSSNKDMLAVWSKPEINNSGKPLQAKLGGTGLGLIALLSIEKFHPGFTSLSDLQKLGNFIVYMQKEDGSFNSKYIPDEGGRSDKWGSLYYPGEAALGLLMLDEVDPTGLWIERAIKALEYLAKNWRGKSSVPVDHWTLLATSELMVNKNIDKVNINIELLINHTLQLCEIILNEQKINTLDSKLDGGFMFDGRITPTSIRLEGLLSALSFLPGDDIIVKEIEDAVHRGISFLLRAQVKQSSFAGGFPRAVGKIDLNTPAIKKFNRRATEVRIDYVQHALSAMIGYIQYINNDKKKTTLLNL